MAHTNVGILGIGVHLPPEIRTNDWWPPDVVDRWREKDRVAVLDSQSADEAKDLPPGADAVLAAMAMLRQDPFHGSITRHVMADGTLASSMEYAAAESALEHAGVLRNEIDALLTNTLAPDLLVTNNACLLHQRLGLPSRCFSIATEAACNSFAMQLSLATALVRAGRASRVLLVQSCNISPLLPYDAPYSAWFGDGASAVVVGPVRDGFGVIGEAHRTAGEFHGTIVAGQPGRRWWNEGPVVIYTADRPAARKSFLQIPMSASEVTGDAMRSASVHRASIDFYAPHQPTAWFLPVTQDYLGLQHSRSISTFPHIASTFGSNIPYALARGTDCGAISEGDIVLTFAGGAGLTYSSIVMRWGGRL